MCAAIFVISAGDGMTVFYAVLKYPYIRLAVFAYAGCDEVSIGDIVVLVFSYLPCFVTENTTFFILVYTSEFFIAGFGKGREA